MSKKRKKKGTLSVDYRIGFVHGMRYVLKAVKISIEIALKELEKE
jgi:hypothetical protein